MKVLLTNHSLGARAGTELYVRDVALALQRRGFTPMAYSTELGEVAEELRAAGVPVVSDLAQLPDTPEVIHGHHHLETLTALLRFPAVPALSFCHGWLPWQEAPLRFPRVRRYVAVDDLCRERLLQEDIAPEQIVTVRNFVDLERFRPRDPLPPQPRRALVFSNDFTDNNGLAVIREACARLGLPLDVAGLGAGSPQARPEEHLGQYDLVFAKGRSALEAMAVGTAVVLCAVRGLGPLVTRADAAELYCWNFGFRTLQQKLDVASLIEQIQRYDAADASAVSAYIRQHASLDQAVSQLVSLYEEVTSEWLTFDAYGEHEAVERYLHEWTPRFRLWTAAPERDAYAARTQALSEELREVREDARHQREEQLTLQGQLAASRRQTEVARAEAEAALRLRDNVRARLHEVESSLSWRWSQAGLRHPLTERLLGRMLRRWAAQRRAPTP